MEGKTNMKKILFLLLLPITCFAQNEISHLGESGTRRISSVIQHGVDSYWINRDLIQDSDRYGSFLNLNADGTFTSWNTAPCGNDCFYRSHGTFKKVDETHIRLQINLSSQSGYCPGGGIADTKPRDLGIFEIKSKSSHAYELIKVNNK